MISLRPMIPDDVDFVRSGWSSSYRTSRYAGIISNKRWAEVMHREIDAILADQHTRVIVACEPGAHDHVGREFLYGFAAARDDYPYLYYVYVKRAYRHDRFTAAKRPRIATRLLEAVGCGGRFTFGALTDFGEELLEMGKFPGAKFDPVPAREAA